MPRVVPQPAPSRMVGVPGHPLVVGVLPNHHALVLLTAVAWARAIGAPVYVAYVDPGRTTVIERPDGSVEHIGLDPDLDDDRWQRTRDDLAAWIAETVPGADARLRYLAGRPDRALTHLARAVDASAIVVGGSAPGVQGRVRDLAGASMSARLVRHQHRPVLVVPLEVVDWSAGTP